jgi:serine/threonine protein kinase
LGTVECRTSRLFESATDASSLEIGNWTVYNYSLGHGTFGIVSLASQQGRQYACKSTDIGDGPDEAIINEIRLLKRMNHANICSILDVVETEERVHVFMPLVVGGDLFGYRDKHGVLSEDECRFAALQLVRGVAYLHKQHIAHRGKRARGRADKISNSRIYS